MNLLSLIGNLASIAGLIITLLLFLRVKSIQKDFLLTARLPELLNQLTSNNNSIQELLTASKEARKARPGMAAYVDESVEDLLNATLEACKSNLVNLGSKIQGGTRLSATTLVTRIERLTKAALKHSDITDIHARLTGLITEIENELKDRKWTKQT